MRTQLPDSLAATAVGREAEAILRSCVHCGFCLPACPTYRLLGDELDSPRGRIYLIKEMLEGAPIGAPTQLHLDRCLTCRACERSCPSGVQYGRLLEIGREVMEGSTSRGARERLERFALRKILPHRRLFALLYSLATRVPRLLPASLRAQLRLPKPPEPSAPVRSGAWPPARHARRVLLLGGCVQAALEPRIDLAAAKLLDRLGITLLRIGQSGCCGAVALHLSDREAARAQARRNIDAFWPHLAAGAEAVTATASACALMLKEYGALLRDDPAYAGRAARVGELGLDVSEIVAAERSNLRAALTRAPQESPRIAVHTPCTLQHGQQLSGLEDLLSGAGFALVPAAGAQLCCGAAGTYSVLQPGISSRLRDQKLAALEAGGPTAIATANIGCLLHLESAARVPVRHWLELLWERLEGASNPSAVL